MEMTTSNVVKNLLTKYQALSSNTISEQVTYEYDEFGVQDDLGDQLNKLEQIKEEEEEEEKEKQVIPLAAIKGLTSSLTSEIIHR